MNLLCVAAGVGGFKCLGGVQHQAVEFTQRGGGFFSLGGFALKGVVYRFAKRVPQFLLLLALDRHALRLVLPALLQRLDGIDVQRGLGAQGLRFFNHGSAMRQALIAGGGQRRVSSVHRGFPLRLDFCKGFFVQVTGLAPFVDKAVQAADLHLPVGVALVGFGPGQHFIDQGAALRLGGFGLLFNGFQPDFNHLVSFVAGVVKALPQCVVGRAALVAGFPQVAHGAQGFLLLAPAHGFGRQQLGFDHQFFANLVGTPALPAFEFAGGRQRGVGGGL